MLQENLKASNFATRRVITMAGIGVQDGPEYAVSTMRWHNIDLDEGVWTLPGQSVKNGKTHRVPLSTAALRILHTRREQRDVAGQLIGSLNGLEPGSHH